MTAADRALVRLLNARTKRLEPRLRAAYFSAVAELQRRLGTDEVVRQIERLELDRVVTDEMLDRAFLRMRAELRREAEVAFNYELPGLRAAASAAGAATPAAIGSAFSAGGSVSFGVLNPRVSTALANLDANILAAVRAEVRGVVVDHLQAALAAGVPGIQAARSLVDVIGLTPTQASHVRNFRDKLERAGRLLPGEKSPLEYGLRDRRFDRTVRKVIASKGTLTTAQIDAMVGAYRTKYVAWHAQTIARTATLNAYTQGQKAAIASALDSGLMPRTRMTKRWVTVGDARVRPEHVAMNGETVAIDALFSNGRDVPDEWNCRCRIRYELTPLATPARRRPAVPATPAPAPAAVPRPPRAPRAVRPPAARAPVRAPEIAAPPPPPAPYVSPWGPGRAKILDDKLREAERTIADLEKERAFGFAADGSPILEKGGGRSSVSFTTAEAQSMKNCFFTHNHPVVSWGFSDADLTFATTWDLAEIRSVTRDGQVSSMLRPPGGWGVDRSRVLNVFRFHDRSVTAELRAQILDGSLPRAEAQKRHYGLVSERIARELGWTFSTIIDTER